MEYSYRFCGIERIQDARPLWEKLNSHHRSVSSHFSDFFKSFTFEDRCRDLESKAESGTVGLIFAEDENGRIAGQCILSVSDKGEGEVDSIFVDEEFRGRGIADQLMRRALSRLDEYGAKTITVMVVSGNEEAWSFYARYGFYPRLTKLTQRADAERREPW